MEAMTSTQRDDRLADVSRTPDARRELAMSIWQARRRRDAIVSDAPPLFGEPAWDILLQLYGCGDDRPLTVSQACYGTNAALSTGLRYVTVLSERGLLVREPSDRDRRSSLLRLSDLGTRMADRLVGSFHQG